MNFSQELSRIRQNISNPIELRNFELFKLALDPVKSPVISQMLQSKTAKFFLAGVLLAGLCAYFYFALLANIVSEDSFASAMLLYLGLVFSGGCSVTSFYASYLLRQEHKAIENVCLGSLKLQIRNAYGLDSGLKPEKQGAASEDSGLSAL